MLKRLIFIILLVGLLIGTASADELGNKFNATSSSAYSLNDADDKICYNFTVRHTGYIQYLRVYVNTVYGDPPAYNIGLKNQLDGVWLINTTYDFTTSGWNTIQLPYNYSVTAGDFLVLCIEPTLTSPDAGNFSQFKYLSPRVTVSPIDSSIDTNYDACYYDTAWHCGYTPVFSILFNDTYEQGQPYTSVFSISIYNTTIGGEKFAIDSSIKVTNLSMLVSKVGVPSGDLIYQIRDTSNNVLGSCNISATSVTTVFTEQQCSVELYLDSGTYYIVAYAPQANSTDYYNIVRYYTTHPNTSLTYGGTSSIRVSSTDNGATFSTYTSEDTFFVIGYVPLPSVILNSPSEHYVTTNTTETITFNATASDSSGLANMTLYILYENETVYLSDTTLVTGTSNTIEWIKTLPTGHYIWKVRACNAGGGCSNSSIRGIVVGFNETHPHIAFDNFTETPGWKYKDEEPYASWNSYIPWYMSTYKITYNFSDPTNTEADKSEQAYHFALAYLISGNTSFAEKAVEGLINLGNSTVDGLSTSSCVSDYAASAAGLYAITYDMMYDYIQANHSDVDAQIRDRLGLWAHYLYTNYSSEAGDVGTRFIRATSMGLIATAMPDYVSPYGSNRDDWLTAATTWLFEQDFTGKPALRKYYNYGGLCRGIESYSGRWLDDFIWWLHAYKKNYNQTLWKLSRDVYNALLYTSLPNGLRPNHGDQGNEIDEGDKSYYVLDLLPSNEAAWHKWFVDTYLGTTYLDKWLGYILYDKHAVSGSKPSFTTVISSDLESAVFRSKWSTDADYLWLRFYRLSTTVYRDMRHNDNMAFEYYSKGDLLLTDSGEIKYYIRDPNRLGAGGYGAIDSKGHNTIMINDGSGAVGGATKGVEGSPVENPAYLRDYLISDYFEFAEANMTITKIEDRSTEPSPSNGWYWGFDTYNETTLTNLVTWKRSVLYPKDYFIVLDTISGSVERDIHNLFHLGSLNKTDTTYVGDNATPGYVHGDLWINGTYIDWLNQTFGDEVGYGLGNLVKWRVTNTTGKTIELYLYSAPKSNITVEKFWTRIGGHGDSDEVDHPIVRFKTRDDVLNRITVLYTIYPDTEQPPTFENLSSSTYTLIHINTTNYDDYIASGTNIVDTNITTDGDYAFVRKDATSVKKMFLRNGTYLRTNAKLSVEGSLKADLIVNVTEFSSTLVNFTANTTNGNLVTFTIWGLQPNQEYVIKKDGITYTTVTANESGYIQFSNSEWSTHTFTIELAPTGEPPQITYYYNNITERSTEITIKPGTTVQFKVSANQPVTWYWNGVDSAETTINSYSSTAIAKFDDKGNYIVTVYGKNENGQTDIISWHITVKEGILPPIFIQPTKPLLDSIVEFFNTYWLYITLASLVVLIALWRWGGR